MENSSKKLDLKYQIIICIAAAIILLGLDILTKLLVKNYFETNTSVEKIAVIDNFFWIVLTYNKGAAWSFLADTSWGRYLLGGLSIVAAVAIIVIFIKTLKKNSFFLRIILSVLFAGCVGNLIDRVNIYNTPGVIDFLSFKLFNVYYFPVFNVADSCITVSMILLIIYLIFFDKDKKDDDVEKAIQETK